jgi:hypothetical protein
MTEASRYFMIFDDYASAESAVHKAVSVKELCWISESLDAGFLAGKTHVTDDQWREFTHACYQRQQILESTP